MQIDLTKSPMLIQLLKNMVIGLTQLSNEDTVLRQRIAEIQQYLHSPKSVDSEQITSTIYRAKDIASYYDIKPHGNKTPGNFVMSLPGIFYHASAELDHLIESKRLMEQPVHPKDLSPNIAQLSLDVKRFSKHSHRISRT